MNAQGSRRYLAYVREIVEGTTPTTPTLKKIRNTGGSGISNERTSIQSAEIRSDRGISDMRLGQNQPNMAVPFELSFGAFDDLLEGAAGDRFNGGVKLADQAVDFEETGALLTHTTTNWTELGVKIGDYIVISGAADAGNNGVFYVSTIVDKVIELVELDMTTPATIADELADTVTIYTGGIGAVIDASANGITVNATGKTFTAVNDVWLTTLDAKVGDWLFFQGFVTAGNNGWHRVTTVTEKVITCSGSTLTNETLAAGDLLLGSFVGILKTNQNNATPTFTIEEGFDDVNQFHNVSGAKVDTAKISFQPDSMVTGEFTFKAMKYVDFAGTTIGTALVEALANMPFDTYTGSLKIANGVTEASAIVSGMELNLANNLAPRYVLMSKDSASIGEGRQNVSGSINAYFPDDALAAIYTAETEFVLEMSPRDVDGNQYYFTMPRVKFTTAKRDTTENDVTQALDFQALIDTNGSTLVIRRSPAVM